MVGEGEGGIGLVIMRCDYAILINSNSKEIMPIAALDIADGPKRSLNNKYKDSLLLWPDGLVEVIKRIDVKGPYGNSWYGKLFSILNSNWSVDVITEKKDFSFDEIKSLITINLKDDKHKSIFFEFTKPVDEIIGEVSNATSIEEVFNILKVNDEGEYLDVL